MFRKFGNSSALWVLAGLALGLGIPAFFGGQPSYATASDHSDEFVMATGLINQELEAVYLLDFTTGRLMGTVLNNQTGKFQEFSTRELAQDFNLAPRAKPKFAIVTGLFQNARAATPVNHVVYVAEMKSGRMVAYYMPLVGQTARGTAVQPMQPIDMVQFRQGAAVRQQ